MTFTLACVMVAGKRRAYTPEYVDKLRKMVARHTRKPFNTVCLTDQPEVMPEGVTPVVAPPTAKGMRGWWRKIDLFNPVMPFGARVLYLDLDVLVVGDLDPIIDFPADFAIAPDSAPNFEGRGQWKTIKGYQSSAMVWDHKSRNKFFTRFDPDMPNRLWGDQDALKEISPNEQTFPKDWFKRVTPGGPENWIPATKVVFCIKYKNHKARRLFPWFEDYWG